MCSCVFHPGCWPQSGVGLAAPPYRWSDTRRRGKNRTTRSRSVFVRTLCVDGWETTPRLICHCGSAFVVIISLPTCFSCYTCSSYSPPPPPTPTAPSRPPPTPWRRTHPPQTSSNLPESRYPTSVFAWHSISKSKNFTPGFVHTHTDTHTHTHTNSHTHTHTHTTHTHARARAPARTSQYSDQSKCI